MNRLVRSFILGALLAALAVVGRTDEAANPLLGTWLLDRAHSTFTPLPGPKGQMRSYRLGDDFQEALRRSASAVDAKLTPTGSGFSRRSWQPCRPSLTTWLALRDQPIWK